MTLGDVDGIEFVAPSGIDFPSNRFEGKEREVFVGVPFTCPLDSCDSSEKPRYSLSP